MSESNSEIIILLNSSLELDLPGNISLHELREKLKAYINNLINSDFQKLVSALYRVDVDEAKLKVLLKQNKDQDAAVIITDLVIERQMQKIKSRHNTGFTDENIPDDEKW